MPPASASRAGVTPEASRDRSSGTFGKNGMKRISLKWWNVFWLSVLVAILCPGLFLFLASRERVIITENAIGTIASAPYAVQGKGILLSRIPDRVFLIERSRFGHVETGYGQTCLARLPMTFDELKSDMRQWKSDASLSFQRHDVSNASRPAYWPDWFPATTPENYIGTIRTSHGWLVSVYSKPDDDSHVYLVY